MSVAADDPSLDSPDFTTLGHDFGIGGSSNAGGGGGQFFGGGRGGSYAADVFTLIQVVRDYVNVPDALHEAEAASDEGSAEGPFGQSTLLHVDSQDTREIVAGLQLFQVSFDAAAVLFANRDTVFDITQADVDGWLADPDAGLQFTSVSLGSWLGDVAAYLKSDAGNAQVFALLTLVAASLSLAAAIASANVLAVVPAAIFAVVAIQGAVSAANKPGSVFTTVQAPSAKLTVTQQAGVRTFFTLDVEGTEPSRKAFVLFLKKTAVWIPVNRRDVKERPTGVFNRSFIVFDNYGGLTDEQVDEIRHILASTRLQLHDLRVATTAA